MRTLFASTLLLAGIGAVSTLQAGEGPWQVRLRAVNIKPADKSDPIAALGIPADKITVSTKVIPEVDISYYFTPNFAAELILTYPQQHDVKVAGTFIGTFKHLPPTLTAQWHFLPGATFNPYVGAGLNLTLLSDVKLAVPGVGSLDLNTSSVGAAVQAGADIAIAPQWSLNVDVKYVQIRSDVKLNGAKISAVQVDPLLLGVGVGYRF
jgi:outer membrane protein